MTEKEKSILKKRGLQIGMIIAVATVTLMGFAGQYPRLEKTDDGRSWHVIWEGNLAQAAEATPGAGAGGILGVYIMNHTATPATAYDDNDSANFETWATEHDLGYANADDTNIDIAHSTDFDIVVRVRGNQTHCWDGSQWVDSYLRVRVSSSDLNLAADTEATLVVSENDSGKSFLWVNCYIDEDQAAGNLNIARDETAEITSIKFEAYY